MLQSKVLFGLLAVIALGVWALVLQNAGILPPSRVAVQNTVDVVGKFRGPIEVEGTVDVANTADVNLSQVVGYRLVSSQRGMFIGIESTDKTIIPIHWGDVTALR